MAAKKRAKLAAVAALLGGGEVPKKAAKAHLSDFIESVDGEVLWILPAGDDTTKALDAAVDILYTDEVRYVLVTDNLDAVDEELRDEADRVVEVEDLHSGVLAELLETSAEAKTAIFILDEELESDLELLSGAGSAGVECLDLASGLAKLEVDEVEDDEPSGESEDEPDEESDDEPEAEDEPAELDGVERLPEEVRELLKSGSLEDAGLKLAELLSAKEIRTLADGLGVGYEKGVWAKTIAKDIIDALIYNSEPVEDQSEDLPDAEPAESARKFLTRVAKEEGSLNRAKADPTPPTSVPVHPEAVINAVTQVAVHRGVEEAGEFLDLIQERIFLRG